jgi:hypothetical protein
LEPLEYTTDDETTLTTKVCAVNVFLTVKLSAYEPVAANDADVAFNMYEAVFAVMAFTAQLEVPKRLPVIPLVTISEPVT